MEAGFFVGCNSNATLGENAHKVLCLCIEWIFKQDLPSRLHQLVHSGYLFEVSADIAFYILQSPLGVAEEGCISEEPSRLLRVYLSSRPSEIALAEVD